MLPSDMNLQIGNVRNYNNKILISSPSFKIGTNVKVNLLSSDRRLNGDVKSKEVDNQRLMVKNEPDVKPKKEPDIKSNKEHKQDMKPNIELRKEDKEAVKMMKTELNLLSSQFNYIEKRSKLNDKITIEPSLVKLNNHEEEK